MANGKRGKGKRKKLIVIGIDGASFDVLNPLLEGGLLPNLKKLKNNGNSAVLKSVIPPVTASAWASFITGNLPGKTEIYDFAIVEDNSWNVEFINRKRLMGKPLWKYLDEAKLKSCFINMPLTYPPEKINGVMISGIETPSEMYNYVYPAELKKELKKREYKIEISFSDKREEKVRDALNVLKKRTEIAHWLLEKDFDFFFVLFRASDTVQHYAWNKKVVGEVYRKIDEFIGEIKDKGDIIVISDHGFENIRKAFKVNSWLEKEGYLKLKKERKKRVSLLVNKERIYRILKIFGLMFLVRVIPRRWGKKIPAAKIGFEEAVSTGLINFAKTRAVAKRAVKCAQIFLNTKKRGGILSEEEKEKLEREIKNKLEKHFAGSKIDAEIKTKEELYGRKARHAPDITIYIKEKGHDTNCLFLQDNKIWGEPVMQDRAEHNINGIIMSNLGLKLNNKEAKIIDLAPTILKYFNIKLGKFDGKSLL